MNIKCIHCKKSHYIKKGFRKTQLRGKIQKYFCLDCNRYFTNDEGFYRMRNNEKKITKAIDLYFSNLSSRKVRNNFRRHEETKISHISVLDWCRRYTLKIHKLVDKLKPNLSGQYYADETEIDRQGNNDIFWCNIDWRTRFINATLYSPLSQNLADATLFMENISKHRLPKYVQTDGLPFYPKAFKRVFYKNTGKREDLPQHRVNNVSKTKKHNVRIETVFMKIKDRVYDFRGLKALWSAPILMAGIVLQHNFIENHTTTGKLPCDLAGLKLHAGINRWLGLIKLSADVF